LNSTKIINFDLVDSPIEIPNVEITIETNSSELKRYSLIEIAKVIINQMFGILLKKKIHAHNERQAWICMLLAIGSGAAIGPMFKYMAKMHINPALSASWRCQCMVLFLLPLAIFEACFSGNPRVEWGSRKSDLPYPIFVHILVGMLHKY